MTQIFYHQFSTLFSSENWAFYYQQMPEDIQERIQRYRKEENKYQLLFGRLLLKEGMQRLGQQDFQLADVFYDDFNCPRWRTGVNFNIAHSGNVVGCAFSDTLKIGLDIEKVSAINLANFDYILNKVDHKNIAKANNSYDAFFKIWTIKEAVTKAIGKGLAIDVQQIYIYDDYAELEGGKWYYKKLDLAMGFAAHLVMNEDELDKIKMKEIYF